MWIRISALAVFVACLPGCGGGGGGGGVGGGQPTPPVTPPSAATAALNSGNAPDVALFSVIAAEYALQLSQDAFDVIERVRLLKQGATVPFPVSEACAQNFGVPMGDLDLDFTDVDQNGRPSPGDTIRVTYRDCFRTATNARATGVVRIELAAVPASAPAADIRYAGKATVQDYSSGVESTRIALTGQFGFVLTESRDLQHVEVTTDATGLTAQRVIGTHARNETLRSASATKEVDYVAARIATRFAGEYVSEAFGGVLVVSTTTPLTSKFSNYPLAGEFRVEGANRSQIACRVRSPEDSFAGGSLDADGNGAFESTFSFPIVGFQQGFVFWDPRSGAPKLGPSGYLVRSPTENRFGPAMVVPDGLDLGGAIDAGLQPVIEAQFTDPVDLASVEPAELRAERPTLLAATVPLVASARGAILTLRAASQLAPGNSYRAPQQIIVRSTTGERAWISFSSPFITRNVVVAYAQASPGAARAGELVTLRSDGSMVTQGTIAARRWTQLSGPAATLTGADTATAGVRVPQGTANGTRLVFRLEVTTTAGVVDVDDVTVIVMNDRDTMPFFFYTVGESQAQGTAAQGAELFRMDEGEFLPEQHSPFQFQFIFRSAANPSRNLVLSSSISSDFALTPGTTYLTSIEGITRLSLGGELLGGCGNGDGRMAVRELQSDARGVVTRAAIDFQIDCGAAPGGPSIFQIRVNSQVPLP
jgi:hypothetical protein